MKVQQVWKSITSVKREEIIQIFEYALMNGFQITCHAAKEKLEMSIGKPFGEAKEHLSDLSDRVTQTHHWSRMLTHLQIHTDSMTPGKHTGVVKVLIMVAAYVRRQVSLKVKVIADDCLLERARQWWLRQLQVIWTIFGWSLAISSGWLPHHWLKRRPQPSHNWNTWKWVQKL